MLASELIKKLQSQIDEHGDIPVFCHSYDTSYLEVYSVVKCFDILVIDS